MQDLKWPLMPEKHFHFFNMFWKLKTIEDKFYANILTMWGIPPCLVWWVIIALKTLFVQQATVRILKIPILEKVQCFTRDSIHLVQDSYKHHRPPLTTRTGYILTGFLICTSNIHETDSNGFNVDSHKKDSCVLHD